MIDFDIEKFVRKYMTGREESLLKADFETFADEMHARIDGKRMLVVGGAGTIGSNYMKAALRGFKPKVMYVAIAEAADEDGGEGGQDRIKVHRHDDQAAGHEQHHHEGHHLFGEGSHALEAAKGDGGSQRHQHKADDQAVEAYALVEGDVGQSGDVEGGLDVHHDLVHLAHGADAERSQQGEDGKQNGQNTADLFAALLAAQTVLQVIHGAAAPFAVFIAAAVVDAQHVFGVVGHHAQERSHPHPEHGTGAADEDCAGDACDVTGTDGSGKSSGQRLDRSDFALTGFVLMEKLAGGVLHPVADFSELDNAHAKAQIEAGADQQQKCQGTPGEIVDHEYKFADSHFHCPLYNEK